MVGYTGGKTKDPTYKDVCRGTTGHAEAVEVTYDPAQISTDELLTAFWGLHFPPVKPAYGSQYRSAVFYLSKEQEDTAQTVKAKLENQIHRTIATEITPASEFYRAEEYHQNYYAKNRGAASCQRR